tara:strand:- start:31 stop:438 length:408 start_codon:yes stop_codon:yes gene_type:complete
MPKKDSIGINDPVGIQIDGGPRLRKAFRNAGDDLGDLKELNKKVAEVVASQAKNEVPVRTGKLKDTIRGAGTKTQGVVRAGFARVPYSGPIHFGWYKRNIQPQPFLYEALDKRRGEVFDKYNKGVRKILKDKRLI